MRITHVLIVTLTVLVASLLSTGCAPIVTAQMDLIDQARRGIQLTGESLDATRQITDELDRLRRLRLDEAFDADVRAQQALTPDWVIAHRTAYAIGLAALAQAQFKSQQADAARRDNLAAIDAALRQARDLMAVQLRWNALVPWPDISPDEPAGP